MFTHDKSDTYSEEMHDQLDEQCLIVYAINQMNILKECMKSGDLLMAC